jgi:hypothetical protein
MASAGVGNVRTCLRLVMKALEVLFFFVIMVWGGGALPGVSLRRHQQELSRNMNENDSHYDSD